MNQRFPSVGGPGPPQSWEKKKRREGGRKAERKGQIFCTKWAWFEACPQTWMGLEIPGDLSD